MKILTNGDIQQSYIKLSLKHFTHFRHIEVSLFLSSPFQKIDEDPDNWWYTTILYRTVTEKFHTVSVIEVSLFLSSPFQIIYKNPDNWWYARIVFKAVTETLHARLTNWNVFFLSSPFQVIDEDADKWWYKTIVYKAVTETLHGLLTNWVVAFPVISISNVRWRSWQMMIYTNRIVYKAVI